MSQLKQAFNRGMLLMTSTLFSLPVLAELPAIAPSKYNLPTPASDITAEIFDLHMLTTIVATVIMIIVTLIIVYSLVYHRKSVGFEADQEFNHTWFGRWSWALVPAIVLGIDFSIAGQATDVLKKIETYDEAPVTVKVTGSQWKWTYDYMDEGLKIVSNLNKSLTPEDELYLRDVDNRLVLPVDTKIRFLHTASDVLHAWWVPSVVFKKDSIPGYINETSATITKEGIYRGQCAEMCGTGHAFMPIVVEVVSQEKYAQWMGSQKTAMAAAAAEASADKTWTLAELTERGEKLYNTNCAACHMPTGTGIPGVFPALKGSPVATDSDPSKHIDVVVKGVAGSAMAAWGNQLNDLDLAAIITYERNAWGNDKGDTVQPADVKAAR